MGPEPTISITSVSSHWYSFLGYPFTREDDLRRAGSRLLSQTQGLRLNVRARHWSQLQFIDPVHILTGLRQLESTIDLSAASDELRTLRRRDVRQFGEGRQAALLCYGLTSLTGVHIGFALEERADYDFVAAYKGDGANNFVPVQLKELVPAHINPSADLQIELDKIAKYADSADLVVAFYLNRMTTIDFSTLRLPQGRVRELWFFWASSPDQSSWIIYGNLLAPNPVSHTFQYPKA